MSIFEIVFWTWLIISGIIVSAKMYIRVFLNGGVIGTNYEKMVFATLLEAEEVISRLKQYENRDIFYYQLKEKANSKEFTFISQRIDSAAYLWHEYIIEYEVIIEYVENMSVIWFTLSKCDSVWAKKRYGQEMNAFMTKKVNAVRIK